MTLTEDIEDVIMEEEDELKEHVDRYNNYMDEKMTYQGVDGWYTLFINGGSITNDDIYCIIDRVKGINRENGLTYLGG